MDQEKIIEAVEKMTVLELNTLVKAIEEKWGVSATAVAAAGPAAAAADEKTSFGVELTAAGDQKVAVIKVVKEALALGLAEAKAFVDGAPKMLKEDMKKEDAEALKTKLEAAGAKVTIK
jgi:large subunit ribosomal protein L7/L12